MYLQLGILIATSFYLLHAASTPFEWHLIDTTNLAIHETGHMFAQVGGEFVMVLGGSLFQALVPLVFGLYFFIKGQRFGALLCVIWAGESLNNVGIYAGDAVAMQLPLLGGDGVGHDWNYLLSETGLLSHTDAIGMTLRLMGWLLMIGASVVALFVVTKEKEEETRFTRLKRDSL